MTTVDTKSLATLIYFFLLLNKKEIEESRRRLVVNGLFIKNNNSNKSEIKFKSNLQKKKIQIYVLFIQKYLIQLDLIKSYLILFNTVVFSVCQSNSFFVKDVTNN